MFQNTVTQSKILLHKAKANHFQKYQRALTCLQTHFLQGSAHKSLLLTAYHPGKVLPIQSFKVMHCDTLQINAAERFPAPYNTHICQGCLSSQTGLAGCSWLPKSTTEKAKRPQGPLSYHRASLFHFRPIQPQIEEQLLFLELS